MRAFLCSDGDIFLTWIEALSTTPNPPLIHSMSYGSLAPEDPKHDILTFNTELCKVSDCVAWGAGGGRGTQARQR